MPAEIDAFLRAAGNFMPERRRRFTTGENDERGGGDDEDGGDGVERGVELSSRAEDFSGRVWESEPHVLKMTMSSSIESVCHERAGDDGGEHEGHHDVPECTDGRRAEVHRGSSSAGSTPPAAPHSDEHNKQK